MNRINVIKMNCINLLGILLVGLMIACDEVEKSQYATDSVPPGQVSDVDVDNVPGGAVITYKVPDDDDLLYVKAVYRMSDGTQVEQKSSAYTTRIVVEGLGRAQKQTVQLICGDLSGNESAPYLQEIDPLDSPIYEIQESIQMTEDYGGINILWNNPLKASVVLTLYVLDEYNRFVEIQNVYTASAEGSYSIRGFPVEERTFAVTVRDRWKNKTDMVSGAYTPWFEEKLDRFKFARWNPPGIPYSQFGDPDVPIERLWNGITENETGYSTNTDWIIPRSITFNLGQSAKLNRIKVWQRTNGTTLTFAVYNVRKFELWGSPHPNVNEDFDTWTFLGDFTAVKPSGLPLGQVTEEDRAYALAGEDYMVQENRELSVQYVRIHVKELWGGGTTPAQFCEIEFYGEIDK